VGTPFVKAGEFDDRFPTIREWTTQPLKYSRTGDVLICVVGATAGKINQAIDCAIGRSVAAIRPDARRLDSDYLYYFMRQKTDAMRAKSQGLAQGVITRDMIADIEIPLPPLDEQKRIAAILDQADELRRKRQRAIDRLNQLGQAIFHEMFGRFDDDFSGWPLHRLEAVVDDAQIGAVRGANEMGDDNPVEYLRMDSIGIDGGLRLAGLKRVNASTADLARYCLRQGDLLFNTRNSKELVGKTAVVRSHFSGIYNNNILRLRFGRMMTSDFLDAFLRTRKGSAILNAIKSGTTSVFAIYQKSFLSLEIPVPPIALQCIYSQKMHEIFLFQQKQTAAADQLSDLFASLQTCAFRGDL
jgi:type I restriction enzyme S subunit